MRFLIGSLFVFALGMWGIWMWQRDDLTASRGPLTASSPAIGEGDVRIDLWIDKSRVGLNEPVAFTLTIQNLGTIDVTDLKIVTFSHDGFDIPKNSRCWREGKPVCIDGKAPPTGKALTLPTHQIVRINASLVANEPGRSSLGCLVAWSSKAGMRSKSITSLPIAVEKEYSGVWRATRTYIKDLGWPLALAVLGFLFKQAEEAQTRLRETWAGMFQLSHTRAEKYWMPLSKTLTWIVISHGEIPRDPAFCFFFLLRLWRQMLDVSRQIGGFFLKTHPTEELLSSCWNIILLWSMAVFGKEQRERAALMLKTTVLTYAEFQDQYKSRPLFTELQKVYEIQSENDLHLIVSVASMMSTVLDFEINRPYADWYEGGGADLDMDELDEQIMAFESDAAYFVARGTGKPFRQDQYEQLRDEIGRVRSRIKKYRRLVERQRSRTRFTSLFGRLFAA